MALALFDLDRTLIDVNSGKLWVHSEWKAGRLTLTQVGHALWWLFKYSLGDADLTYAFEAAVGALEGEEEAVIIERTREWFARDIRHHLRPGGQAALEAHREAGDRLVLATGGTLYAAREACAAYGLTDHLCTIPEVVEGRFTGRVEAMGFGGGKLQLVRDWAEREGEDLSTAWFYTDSFTDLPLLEEVGHPVIVAPDRKLARVAAERGWEVVDW